MENEKRHYQNSHEDWVYEGTKPYVFISYSHKNKEQLDQIIRLLRENRVRFWYDKGLYSGADYNSKIAEHISSAACCLLLLTRNTVESGFIRDELNLARYCGIPLHTVQFETFEIPKDLYLMIGRFNIIETKEPYANHLLRSLPSEVFDMDEDSADEGQRGADDVFEPHEHPLYEMQDEIRRQAGAVFYKGRHRTLGYPVTIVEETLHPFAVIEAKTQACDAAGLNCSLFPKIFDVRFQGNRMWTYQEFRGEVPLEEYMDSDTFDEEDILAWMKDLVEALQRLEPSGFGMRTFRREVMTVLPDGGLGMWRMSNPYYGMTKIGTSVWEADRYQDMEDAPKMESLAELFYEWCTGRIPSWPVPMITSSDRSHPFLEKVNLIIQKCSDTLDDGSYRSYEEILSDLDKRTISIRDKMFLKKRKYELEQYGSVDAPAQILHEDTRRLLDELLQETEEMYGDIGLPFRRKTDVDAEQTKEEE